MLTIQGSVEGDVTFFGQVLIVEAGEVIHGDVHSVGAQTINVMGQLLGEINGSYQTLDRADDIELNPQRIELE